MAMNVSFMMTVLVFLTAFSYNGVQGRTISNTTQVAAGYMRTPKENLLNGKSSAKRHSYKIHPLDEPVIGESRAFLTFTTDASQKSFGVDAQMSIDNPTVGPEQSSWSLLWIESGDIDQDEKYSILQAGWGISPEQFGDSQVHLVVYWHSTSEGDDAGGCYNDDCHGFVHTNKEFPFNYVLKDASEYDGLQFNLRVEIIQDSKTKDWWLTFNNVTLGYWSKDVVPHLIDGVARLSFGGITTRSKEGYSPPMGFGKFPDKNLKHSGYFKNIHAVTKEGNRINPVGRPQIIVDKPNCYNLYAAISPEDEVWLAYGGPGGACHA